MKREITRDIVKCYRFVIPSVPSFKQPQTQKEISVTGHWDIKLIILLRDAKLLLLMPH